MGEETTIHSALQKQQTKDADPDVKYIAVRYIEMICIGVCIFGALWEGTIRFNLTTPQFFMIYGGAGAIITEVLARIFKKKENIKK